MVMTMRVGIMTLVLLLTAAGLAFSVSGIPCPIGAGNGSCMVNGACSENCTCPNQENCTENCTCLNNGSCVLNCSGNGPCPIKDAFEQRGCSATGKGCPLSRT
jgi:hypothetical protein